MAWLYFALVLILSLPFYALGTTGASLPFAPALPISAIMAMLPMIAAALLVWRRGKGRAVIRFFRQSFAVQGVRHMRWIIASLVIMPVAFALTAGLVWLSGTTLPTLQSVRAPMILASFALFFIGAVGEEIGWQGYAYPSLTKRYSALQAALIIGVVWGLWHVIPFALMGRSAGWIIWQCAGMVLMRVIIVWLVVNAGRGITVAVLFHVMSNSVWGMFADFTAYYDPMLMCAVLGVAVVVILWRNDTTLLMPSGNGHPLPRHQPIPHHDLAPAGCGDFLVMGRDQERRPLIPVDLADQFHHLGGRGAVKVAGGFIRQHQFGAVHQGAGDGDALFLAARQVA